VIHILQVRDHIVVSEGTSDNETHMRFLVIADKLGLEDLFNLLGQSYGDKIHGKTTDQIRKEWHVVNYTPLTPFILILFYFFFICVYKERKKMVY
jgi:hypothetical protein